MIADLGAGRAPVEPREDEWLVIVDPQTVFAGAESPWVSPMWPDVVPRIVALAEAYGERVVITRFVADPSLGGTWKHYYDQYQFALVPEDDELYDVVPELAPFAERCPVVTAGTFGKWNADLRAVVGDQPRIALAGVATDCCVVATALPAADAGADIRVVADACAGSSPENHENALNVMRLFAPQILIY